jgi:hypothetical protein
MRTTGAVKSKLTMWSSGATLLALLLVFVRPALGDACVLTMGSQYQLRSDTVDWTMQTSSGQSCTRGLRHSRVTIDTAKLIISSAIRPSEIVRHGIFIHSQVRL